MKTQAEVDREINRLMLTALKYEIRRDSQSWESPLYWRYHDQAINAHERARKLMPKGS